MISKSEPFLGVGWKFPIEFKKTTKGVTMLSGEEVIQNSLDVLFSTNIGERIMQHDYGSELNHFVFENMATSTITYMQAIISDAILFYEPRIIVSGIDIKQRLSEPLCVDIIIDYTISATNNRYNYVYPFYLKEGTNLLR